MTTKPPERPHFRRPPILEQAISLNFERISDFDVVDFGLFWDTVRDDFPHADTAPRFSGLVESFDEIPLPIPMMIVPPLQIPRSLFRNDRGELVQVQDDSFGFNWIKPSDDSAYPRFEKTSSRLWELYGKFLNFLKSRSYTMPTLRQCEITNVNVVLVEDFGRDFSDMTEAFVVDPFEWEVDGLIAETYIRRRQHKIVNQDNVPIGRLHSVITPVFSSTGQKAFQFELTARSPPTIRNEDDAKAFFDRAHKMINAAFWVSVTPRMRDFWGVYDG